MPTEVGTHDRFQRNRYFVVALHGPRALPLLRVVVDPGLRRDDGVKKLIPAPETARILPLIFPRSTKGMSSCRET